MADFNKAYALTREYEGGYSNHPNDTGGETYKGIARRPQSKWKGWKIIDQERYKPDFPNRLDSNKELQALVHELYKKEYWDSMKLDDVKDQLIANEMFDTGVNMGIGRAGIFLQRVLNVANKGQTLYPNLKVDGQVGKVTIGALNSHPQQRNILAGINALKGAQYITICENNPSQEVFFNGWMKRVFAYAK
jgi:lysozyme family protein